MQLKTIPEDFIVAELADHALDENGGYALLELTKRNTTTEKALSFIADSLHLQRKAIGYAGTKDSRAITRQYVTIRTDNSLERLPSNSNVTVRLLGRVTEPLRLGMLDGNRFEIVVRKLTSERPTALAKLPNYFDEQRFSTSNAQLGKHILKQEFKEAINLLLTTDDEVAPRVKQYLETRMNDYIGALRLIPKNILLMYVHAYQSLLFNEVLRKYIKENDLAAVAVDGPVPLLIPTKAIPDAKIPIFGFGTEGVPVFGAWYEEVLAREGLVPRDFVVRQLPFLTVEGGERDAFFIVNDLTIGDPEPDDIFPEFRKQKLTFSLPKGCYATMVVKCLYRTGRVLSGPERS